MYELVSLYDRGGRVMFMNYGYAPLESSKPTHELTADQEPDRYCIQLYAHVVGRVDLVGKDVLEVGCGRGGGSDFIMRYFHPRTMTGMDLAHAAIRFCRRRYRAPQLKFAQGDAELIPFPDESFDAIANVESSHNYPDFPQFLRESRRVLRPQGHLLFADHRPAAEMRTLREQLGHSGMAVLEEEQIGPNVVHALELDSERRLQQIRRYTPKLLRGTFEQFSGVRGSELYENLRSGQLEYCRFVLQKA